MMRQKRVKGRKRHVVVDTDGRLLTVNLTAADIQDVAGAEAIVAAIRRRWPWLRHLFANGAYDRGRLMSLATYHSLPSKWCANWPLSRALSPYYAAGW
jgi:putative transposase